MYRLGRTRITGLNRLISDRLKLIDQRKELAQPTEACSTRNLCYRLVGRTGWRPAQRRFPGG